MTKTLLAVDDSVTMRKVLEITFSGEDFRVITAENAQTALASLAESPAVFLVDSVLIGGAGEDGYTLAKELRRRCPGAAILLLTSRYAPYDPARGQDAGADDWSDKPFDTQQLIDKVRKAVVARESAPAAVISPVLFPSQPSVAPQAAGAAPLRERPPVPTTPHAAPTQGGASPIQGGSGGFARGGTLPSVGGSASAPRTGTLMFGDSPAPAGVHPAGPMPPRPAPPAARPPPPAPVVPASMASVASPVVAAFTAPAQRAVAPVAAATAIGDAVNGQLASKLGALGLSKVQADAVLELSRDVVERVVWEVVPQLAETMIKEEIQRLMRA